MPDAPKGKPIAPNVKGCPMAWWRPEGRSSPVLLVLLELFVLHQHGHGTVAVFVVHQSLQLVQGSTAYYVITSTEENCGVRAHMRRTRHDLHSCLITRQEYVGPFGSSVNHAALSNNSADFYKPPDHMNWWELQVGGEEVLVLGRMPAETLFASSGSCGHGRFTSRCASVEGTASTCVELTAIAVRR
jgi:hypothetical protein